MTPTLADKLQAPELELPLGVELSEDEPVYAAYSAAETLLVELAFKTIREKLDEGVYRFSFFAKIKQRVRTAVGTRNQAYFSYTFRGGSIPFKFGLIRYWDFTVAPDRFGSRWRSFYIASKLGREREARSFPGIAAPAAVTVEAPPEDNQEA